MDAWAHHLQAAVATEAAARAQAASILLQLSSGSGFRGGANPPASEPAEQELPPAAVAERRQIIAPQDVVQPQLAPANRAADAQVMCLAAPFLSMMPSPGHVNGGGPLYKPAPPVEHRSGIITGSCCAAALGFVRDQNKGKLPVPDAANNNPIMNPNKRRLHDIQLQAAQDPPARPRIMLPLPASRLRFACSRCDLKFPTSQALGGHMAGHSRANKDGTEGEMLLARLAVDDALQSFYARKAAVPRANTAAAGASSGLGHRTVLPPPPTAPILGDHMLRHQYWADKLPLRQRPHRHQHRPELCPGILTSMRCPVKNEGES